MVVVVVVVFGDVGKMTNVKKKKATSLPGFVLLPLVLVNKKSVFQKFFTKGFLFMFEKRLFPSEAGNIYTLYL